MCGTCSWIWRTNFATWLKQGQGLFWIQGKAASGKSTLVKYIVSEIKRDQPEAAAVISYHINKNSDGLLCQTKQGISRALLWKILIQKPQYFAHILQDFKDMKTSFSDIEWSHGMVHNALLAILAEPHTSPLYVFIDGIDECSGDLLDVVDMCFEMIASAAKNVRICVASRPERELSFCLENNSPPDTNNMVLEEHTSSDIEKCVEQELGRVSRLFTADILAQLVTSISQQANGFFMWAKLASRDIGRAYMKHRVTDHQKHLSRLRLLPTECSELYWEILQRRTGSSDYGEAIFMLSLVAIGTKEFTVAEFHKIVTGRRWSVGRFTEGIRPGSIKRHIEWSAGGLLEVRSNRVAFSHGTVFLFAKGLLQDTAHRQYTASAYFQIADACLEALYNFDWLPTVNGAGLEPRITAESILWEYAIHNWTRHVQEAKEFGVRSGLKRQYCIHPGTAVAMQRTYLARCWDHQSATQSRLDSPIARTLAQMVLVEMPVFDLGQDHDFGDVSFAYDSGDSNDSGENEEHGWHSSRMLGYKDFDMMVTIQSAANYQISFHSTEALRSGSNSMACIVTHPGANILLETANISDDDINAHTLKAKDFVSKVSKETHEMPRGLSEQHHPIHLHSLPRPGPSTVLQMAPSTNAGFSELQPRQTRGSRHGSQHLMSTWNRRKTPTVDMCDISPQCYTDPVSINACSLREFRKLKAPRAQLLFAPRLLAQIKHVLYDYCRSRRERRLDERADTLAKGTEHVSSAAATSSARYDWATPIQYAAYHGMSAVVEELHRRDGIRVVVEELHRQDGIRAVIEELHRQEAVIWLPWHDNARFGSALMAAIWGVYDNPNLQDDTAGVAAVRVLLKLNKNKWSLGILCNAGRLGHISPLLAAVKLFYNDRRRSGQRAERLLNVISILLGEGIAVDRTARVMMRCHPDLKLLLDEFGCDLGSLAASGMSGGSSRISSMPISSVGSGRGGRGGKQNTNASIGYLLPSAGVLSAAYDRLAQTSD
ncbi:ankyrin repeat domain-containing protein 50 [Microdochium nivale]|nr:ankyrin repeat domain-containing protein 50 [Microdochium nivale]